MHATGAQHFWMDDHPRLETLRLRRAPLLAAALAFAYGELLPRQWHFAIILLAALALLLAVFAIATRHSPRLAALPVLAIWVVTGCWCAQMQPSPPPQTDLRAYADGLSRTVRGHVVRIRTLPSLPNPNTPSFEPGAWEAEGSTPTESIDLTLDRIESVTTNTTHMVPIAGGVRVTLLDGSPTLHCGDTIEIPLRLRVPDRYLDPGAWSSADQLLSEGIAVHANAKASLLTIAGHSPQTLRCRAFAAQAWAAHRVSTLATSAAMRHFPPVARFSADDVAMLNAMLFGDRSSLRSDLRLGFERTGSFHLFVVSGLHVALLAGLLFAALRRLRAPQALATLGTIAATTAYAALTGFGVPVQRALLMTTVFLLARWLYRNTGILQALGAAALTVLALDPRALTEASFQMTFLVLVAVGGLAIPLMDRSFGPHLSATRNIDAIWTDPVFPPHLAQFRLTLRLFGEALASALPSLHGLSFRSPLKLSFRSAAKESASPTRIVSNRAARIPARIARLFLQLLELAFVSLVIEACMILPMAVYFHRATPFAIPANLLAIPLISILAPLAVLTFCASLVSSWVAAIPAAVTALVLHAVSWTIAHLSHLRFADARIPAPPPTAIACAVTAIAFACWAVRQRSRWFANTGIAALLLVPTLTLWPFAPALHPNTLELTAIDVGQGDSLLIVSPDGHTLLVDAGGPVGQAPAAATRWDVGEQVVAPFLWSRRLRTLDAVAISHAHSDHMGGLPAILRDFHPRELWLSIDPADAPDLRALLAQAAALHIRVRHFHAGDAFPWGGLQTSVLSPEPAYTNHRSPTNDDSLVLRFDYGRASLLLEGDAELNSETTMLANHRLSPVTLLKVGHHGSRTSSNPAFLSAVSPREAVISVGRHNTFGHPRPEVLARLESAHIQTFRTDRHGATTFLLTPDGTVSHQPSAP